jgi:Tol biopolymer transport system component
MAERIGGGMRWFLLSLALIFALAVCVCTLSTCMHRGPAFLEPQDMSPSWAPDSTQVVFVCYRRQRVETRFGYSYLGPYDGLEGYKLKEICVSDLDGSNRHQLTDNLDADLDPSWSPIGNQIVFVSKCDTEEGADIYVMSSDGTDLVNLTEHAAGYSKPRWSPDGSAIAFTSTRDTIVGDLYMMTMDDHQMVRLTEREGVSEFSWSPDGHSIVFEGGFASDQEIFVLDVEDGSIVQMTDNDFTESRPVWSPDGRRIAFGSQREDGFQVYVMDVQTREETRISEGLGPSSQASWSPNGRLLAYVSGGLGFTETLHILDTETGASKTFSDFQAIDRFLWSPDSQYLIYERLEDWNKDGFKDAKLWVLQVDDGTGWVVSSVE